MITVFDVETSGLPVKWQSNADAVQPHIASMAAICYTDDGKAELNSAHFFVRPDGWVMDEETSKHNGLTTEFLQAYGVPIEMVLTVMDNLFFQSSRIVAYNMDFDARLYEIESIRAQHHNFLEPGKRVCAMKPMTNLLQLPGQYGDYKWPKLAESYAWLFQTELTGAHNALQDARHAGDIFFGLQEAGLWVPPG